MSSPKENKVNLKSFESEKRIILEKLPKLYKDVVDLIFLYLEINLCLEIRQEVMNNHDILLHYEQKDRHRFFAIASKEDITQVMRSIGRLLYSMYGNRTKD